MGQTHLPGAAFPFWLGEAQDPSPGSPQGLEPVFPVYLVLRSFQDSPGKSAWPSCLGRLLTAWNQVGMGPLSSQEDADSERT